MEKLLEHFLEQVAESGDPESGVALQLTFKNGYVVAGAVKRGPLAGVYKIGTVGMVNPEGNPGRGGGEQIMLEQMFLADDLCVVTRPMEQSRIVVPKRSPLMV